MRTISAENFACGGHLRRCVAVSGAQGVGKTTFCQDLRQRLEEMDLEFNVCMRGDVARTLKQRGVGIDGATKAHEYPLYLNAHLTNLREASEGSELTILDRTLVDTLSYAIANGNLHVNWLHCMTSVARMVLSLIQVYFFIPVEPWLPLVDDNVRETDKEYQMILNRVMWQTLTSLRKDIVVIKGSREARVSRAIAAMETISERLCQK